MFNIHKEKKITVDEVIEKLSIKKYGWNLFMKYTVLFFSNLLIYCFNAFGYFIYFIMSLCGALLNLSYTYLKQFSNANKLISNWINETFATHKSTEKMPLKKKIKK